MNCVRNLPTLFSSLLSEDLLDFLLLFFSFFSVGKYFTFIG